ncbi:hypothetical protein QBC35DRAFT_172266 [Podospora australis]|uniref:NAD(P)-binding protein n=1 Tax=Podospora australis TaxID=1536484 RepID=A0AAN6WZ10_9PEZI|nr:hypothetical protein QBC35DRAFT_172266 [Podospora australis]
MGAQWSQFFPPTATFTERDVPPQDGRIFLITGGTSGIGFELAKILYGLRGKVYIAGRSQEKAQGAIRETQTAFPDFAGSLDFIYVDLADLSTIKPAVETFKTKDPRLDILFNSAGVSQPPLGSVSKQGIELSVPNGGLLMSEIRSPPTNDNARNYTNSKTGNNFLSAEFERRNGNGQSNSMIATTAMSDIISVSLNPGAVKTELFRHTPYLNYVAWPLLYSPKLAAYTLLFAGLSRKVAAAAMYRGGWCYVVPWGRLPATGLRGDIVDATKEKSQDGKAVAEEFWEWCEDTTRGHL